MGYIFGLTGIEDANHSRRILDCMHQACAYRGTAPPHFHFAGQVAVGCGSTMIEDRDSPIFIDPDSGTICVLEGEIYNIDELASHLASHHMHTASSVSTSTIISRLYHRYGVEWPRSINGIFASAIWDPKEKSLLLARDHVGSHSLFYWARNDLVIFGSTIKSLLAASLFPGEIDDEAINMYFASKALTAPLTMYKGIRAVKPGHVICISSSGIREHDYWQLGKIQVDYRTSSEDLKYQLRHLIHDSIESRWRAQGKAACIVSGGVDSGAVAATIAKSTPHERVNAFSVSFSEDEYDDSSLQKILINSFNMNHHSIIMKPAEFAEILRKGASYLDSPVNDNAYVGMYKVMEVAKDRGFDVIFEGEGPDEIFPAGNTHGERELLSFLHVPSVLRRIGLGWLSSFLPIGDSTTAKIGRYLSRLGMEDNERRLTWRPHFHTRLRHKLLPGLNKCGDPYCIGKDYLRKCTNKDPLNLYQYGLIKTFLADDLLYKNERMASAHNIVNRTPLVDYRLVELALRIPSTYQISKPRQGFDGIKLLYRKALTGTVPDQILLRSKKRGFSQPSSIWYRTELRDFLYDALLSGSRSKSSSWVDQKFLKQLIEEHCIGRNNHDYYISSILIFELWLRAQ